MAMQRGKAKGKGASRRRGGERQAAQPASGAGRLLVYKETQEDGSPRFRVYPGGIVLKEGDDLELVNVAGGDADWDVPAGPLGGGAVKEKVKNKKSSPPQKANAG